MYSIVHQLNYTIQKEMLSCKHEVELTHFECFWKM